MKTWIVATNDQIADADALREAFHNIDRNPTPETLAWRAAQDALYSEDRSDLTPDEGAAAAALYADDDIEVGHEGIGGFAAGQAEATIRTLRKAGFRVTRE